MIAKNSNMRRSGRRKASRPSARRNVGITKQRRKTFEQNPDMARREREAQTPRSTWEPTQGLVGPGPKYFALNQTPTPQQDAAPLLYSRPFNLHPHHRYLPIGKEMDRRANDAGRCSRLHTLAHLECARRRPSSKER
jgi:hypothetical protein